MPEAMPSEMWILGRDRTAEGTGTVQWCPSLSNEVLVHLDAFRPRSALLP